MNDRLQGHDQLPSAYLNRCFFENLSLVYHEKEDAVAIIADTLVRPMPTLLSDPPLTTIDWS